MEVLCHRGLWHKEKEMNMSKSFHNAFSSGLSIETDIRDYGDKLVISHDSPYCKSMSVAELFKIYQQYNNLNTLALNIKSDGLQLRLKKLIEDFNIKNYYVFDMSVPDTLDYKERNLKFFSRQSEIEKVPVLYDSAIGIWLDMFYSDWITLSDIIIHVENDKKLSFVSPELHGREHISFWKKVKKWEITLGVDFMLCTDFPYDAKEYFCA